MQRRTEEVGIKMCYNSQYNDTHRAHYPEVLTHERNSMYLKQGRIGYQRWKRREHTHAFASSLTSSPRALRVIVLVCYR